MIIKTLQSLLILAFMTIGFIFVGAFVEYKALNGANIYASLIFLITLCTTISAMTFLLIKDFVLNEGV